MTLLQRYRRLTLWNKVGFWGSVASIIGLVIAFVTLVLPDASSTQVKASNGGITVGRDLNQQAAPGGTAIIQTGNGKIITEKQESKP